MPENINAEIIAIGTEILLGEITDTNSVYIARLLRDIGLNLYYMTSVGDNELRISDSIRIALSRAQVVITCGGLGPTIDDMTRQAVANATNRELIFHQDLLDKIAERFTNFRVQMSDNNRRQAYLPADAIVIENPVGTAPSYIVEHEGKVVISLPGVPREMKFLMTESVIPYLREHFNLGSGIIKARVLRTAGIGESLLDAQIGPELLEGNNPTVGLAAHTGQVDIRITAKADSETKADEMIAVVEEELRSKIGRFIYGVDQDQIEVILTRILSDRHTSIAISETGIGNPISSLLTSVPGMGEIISGIENFGTPTALKSATGIDLGINIRDLAEYTTSEICKRYATLAAIAVVSEPTMGEFHADNESGTAIAVCLNGKTRSRVFGFGGQTDIAQNWVSTWSMSTLWQMLQE